jgi:hypothetical protein
MEPRLDAEVEQINDAIDLKANTADLGEAAYLDLDEFDNIGNLDYVQFDTTYAVGSEAPGQLAWSPENETLEFQLDAHVTLQVGQEHVMRVKNNSGSVAIPERTVVMFAGAAGDTIKVAPAVSDGSVNVNYLAGITTENIAADGFGFVTQLGFINQVNTNAWPVGTILYVDPAVPGGLTATEPESPAWTMPVAAVTKQNASSGRLLVRAIPGGSGAGGGASVVISDTVPAGGNKGDLWLDGTDGTLYIYFEDVDGSQWIQVQANSALEGSILERLGALEAQMAANNTGYALRQTVYFTSSGAFTKATYPWLRAIKVIVQAGGAGGSGRAASNNSGGGGGGGGYAEIFFTDIAALPASVSVTVGAGGAGGAAGNNLGSAGGVSEFGTTGNAWRCRATGGLVGGSISEAGSGGIGTHGQFISGGGGSGRGQSGTPEVPGTGGSSRLGGGGRGVGGNAGEPGQIYGGGGAGASVVSSAMAGGNGAPGIVIVELYA